MITTEKGNKLDDNNLIALAEKLFNPIDKNPYYLNGKPLGNLQDLIDNLETFNGDEGQWVATWLEYLGDGEIVELINKSPGDFKLIVKERYEILKNKSGKGTAV